MVVQASLCKNEPHLTLLSLGLFFGDQISLAGGILLADTILSAAGWFEKKLWKKLNTNQSKK